MFFLRRDSGVLRTICDYYRRYVAPVSSCADPHLRLDRGKPLGDHIIDLLLSKGHNCTEAQRIAAISHFNEEYWDLEYAIRKMRQIAADGTPAVREAACEWLFSWKQPCPSAAENSRPKER